MSLVKKKKTRNFIRACLTYLWVARLHLALDGRKQVSRAAPKLALCLSAHETIAPINNPLNQRHDLVRCTQSGDSAEHQRERCCCVTRILFSSVLFCESHKHRLHRSGLEVSLILFHNLDIASSHRVNCPCARLCSTAGADTLERF